MKIESAGLGTLAIILVMAVVTLATRLGGVYVMSFVPIGYRIKLFIQAMSGSVLVAILTPIVATGDSGARIALLTTVVMMLLLNKPLPAITCGVAIAAFIRNF